MRARRAGLALTVIGLVLSFALVRAAVADPPSLEYAIKASYLYKFVPFVEWPGDAFPSPTSPVRLCIALYDPFGDIIDRAVAGQRIGDRPIVVERLAAVDRQSGCHILYLGGGAPAVVEILQGVRGTPVLTVTDGARDPAMKGIINFVTENNRVRFEIDDRAAAENGLVISSKLLSLAVSVQPRR
jgi:uncharacterized protein DUF4154